MFKLLLRLYSWPIHCWVYPSSPVF